MNGNRPGGNSPERLKKRRKHLPGKCRHDSRETSKPADLETMSVRGICNVPSGAGTVFGVENRWPVGGAIRP
jgi:hypothetical protein